jgi:hypothetical protein
VARNKSANTWTAFRSSGIAFADPGVPSGGRFQIYYQAVTWFL